MKQNKKLLLNTISSIVLQIIQVVSGFILPVLIIRSFGSTVNGLISSVTQFLAIISFMDMGVNLVIQSSYYEPLVNKDREKLSILVRTASNYYHKLGIIIAIYCGGLALIYPAFVNSGYGFGYVATLILIMSVSNFSQFFFGITYQNLIIADQSGYILFFTESLIVLANLIFCYIAISLGAGVHLIKIITVGLYLLKPAFQIIYVYKHYRIDRQAPIVKSSIPGKKEGIALHLSSVILNYTDPIVLTAFSTLENVSIYSVYLGIINNVNKLVGSVALNGFRPKFGELYARKDYNKLRDTFSWVEWLYNGACVVVFGSMGMLISPFVSVYTRGITDAVYFQPVFGVLLTIAYFFSCIVMPYHCMVSSVGHFRQTKKYYTISAIINVVISIFCVRKYGIIGVTVGTTVAMCFQTICLLVYSCKYILKVSVKNSMKQFGVDLIIVAVSALVCSMLHLTPDSYKAWFGKAICVFSIWVVAAFVINYFFYKKKIFILFSKILKKEIINDETI